MGRSYITSETVKIENFFGYDNPTPSSDSRLDCPRVVTPGDYFQCKVFIKDRFHIERWATACK